MLKNIVLLGMMASGKTTLGKILSKKLKINFIDTDLLIEKQCGLKISKIFDKFGENYFRKKEEKIILKILSNKKPSVIALGGGSFLNKKLQNKILKENLSIWLKPGFNIIYNRCKNSYNRPLLKNNNDLKVAVKKLINERYPVYSKADIQITKNNKPKILCNIIIEKLKKKKFMISRKTIEKN